MSDIHVTVQSVKFKRTRADQNKDKDKDKECLPGDDAIRVDGLCKVFQTEGKPHEPLMRLLGFRRKVVSHGFHALRNVCFRVRKGETVGIVGRNGSGKSTLLQMICGTLHPTSGTVRTNGRIAALLELGAGFNPEFTGRENVYMNATLFGLNKAEIDSRFEDIVAFADIGDFLEQPIKTYSSGMSVRLAFAVAVHVNPDILIVDEALSVGDELFQRKCIARIEAIKRGGATILFVSHSGSTVVALCDRALLLDEGELLLSGSPKAVMGRYQRLIYAPANKRAAIREEIRSAQPANDTIARDMAAHPVPVPAKFEPDDFYDSGLRPHGTIAYESRGARIEAPEIFNLAGEKVNCLQRGRTYRYTYRIYFDRPATGVRFGMLIKTVAGVEIGGATSAKDPLHGIPSVAAGTVMRAEYRFVCRLNAGLYFVNAGVSGDAGEGFSQLFRLIDATCFRVNPEYQGNAVGVVDFECQPDWTLCK